MTHYFNRTSYKDQLVKLEKSAAWLANLGIDIENTRFSETLKLNLLIVEHQGKNNLERLINEFGIEVMVCIN